MQRRSWRLLALMATASFALHFLLLAALPGFVSEPRLVEPLVLDVVLAQPEKRLPSESTELPPTAPVPAPPRRVPNRTKPASGERPHIPAKKPSLKAPPRPEVEIPQIRRHALPSGPAPAAPAIPKPSEPEAPAPAPPAASPALPELTPPSFNASYLRNPPPRYPTIARRNGEQGTVTVRVLVSKEGMPARVNIERTSGSRHLDTAALDAVRTWRFVPARRGAERIEAWVLVPIVFRLEGAS